MPVDPAPVGNIQGSPITKRVQITGARAPTKVKESRRLLAKPIPGNHVQSRFGTRRLDQRNPGNEMSPIVLRQPKGCVILMTGEIGCRRLGIENLIERGFGSGDSLGERFYPRTYSLEGFFSSRCVGTQSSGLAGNRLVAKVARRMLGFRWRGIVWAGIEFFHEEVDLFTAQNSGITQKPRSSSEEAIAVKSVMSIPSLYFARRPIRLAIRVTGNFSGALIHSRQRRRSETPSSGVDPSTGSATLTAATNRSRFRFCTSM